MKKFNSGTKLAGTASLLNAALITGSFGLWVHWASAMFSTAAQTVIRFALAALILIALSAYQRPAHPIYRITGKVPWLYIPRRVIGLVVLLGVGTFGLGMLYTSAVHATKVASAMSLLSAGSIITASFVGTLFLREKATVGKVLAILIALTGLFLYADGFHELSMGVALALGAGACDGACNCIRKLLRGTDRTTVVIYQYGLAALLTIPFLLQSRQTAVTQFQLWSIAALLIYAILSVGLGSLLLLGFARVDANVGAVIMASQIFFAMLLGALVLHEFPTLNEFVGGLLIFSASFFAVADFGKLRRKFMQRKLASTYRFEE